MKIQFQPSIPAIVSLVRYLATAYVQSGAIRKYTPMGIEKEVASMQEVKTLLSFRLTGAR